MDRIVPPRKDRPVPFLIPKLEKATDAVMASTAIVEAVASGDLTPSEAAELSKGCRWVHSHARSSRLRAAFSKTGKRYEQMRFMPRRMENGGRVIKFEQRITKLKQGHAWSFRRNMDELHLAIENTTQ